MIQATSTFRPGTLDQSCILSALSAGIKAGAELIAEEARLMAPVDTGALAASIEAREPEISGNSVTAVVVAAEYYAAYVEYGTGQRGSASPGAGPGPYDPNWPGMAAQPYMRPAIDTRRADVLDAINAEVRGAF